MSEETFWKKVNAYQKWVEDSVPKEKRTLLQSPIYKALWKLRLKVLPVPYQGNFSFLLATGVSFSVLWHITFLSIMILLFDFTIKVSTGEFTLMIVLTFLFAIIGFGFPMLLLRNKALKKYNIPDWSNL